MCVQNLNNVNNYLYSYLSGIYIYRIKYKKKKKTCKNDQRVSITRKQKREMCIKMLKIKNNSRVPGYISYYLFVHSLSYN